MMVTYIDKLEGFTAADFDRGFFEGWPQAPSPERHLDLLRGSYRVVLALDDSTGGVVGFVNAVGDGVLAAYIPLLEVLPDFRGRGIATELMRRMLDGLDLYMTDVACDDDLIPFYERVGMQRSNAMIRRNYEWQSAQPAEVKDEPDAFSPALETYFLDNYARFVAGGHAVVANTLVEGLREPSDVTTGHALFRRLHGELFIALESLAAWGHALRVRGDASPGLMRALTRYRNHHVDRFYERVAKPTFDAQAWLRLPDGGTYSSAIAAGPHLAAAGADADEGSTAEAWDEGMELLTKWLREAAEIRGAFDGLLVTLYNKSKHGLPFLHVQGEISEKEMRVVLDDGEMASFTISAKNIELLRNNTEVIGKRIRHVADIARVLALHDILYPAARR